MKKRKRHGTVRRMSRKVTAAEWTVLKKLLENGWWVCIPRFVA